MRVRLLLLLLATLVLVPLATSTGEAKPLPEVTTIEVQSSGTTTVKVYVNITPGTGVRIAGVQFDLVFSGGVQVSRRTIGSFIAQGERQVISSVGEVHANSVTGIFCVIVGEGDTYPHKRARFFTLVVRSVKRSRLTVTIENIVIGNSEGEPLPFVVEYK